MDEAWIPKLRVKAAAGISVCWEYASVPSRFGAQLKVRTALGAGTEVELSIPGSVAYGTATAGKRWRFFRKNASNS
jgi:hypothetical protein